MGNRETIACILSAVLFSVSASAQEFDLGGEINASFATEGDDFVKTLIEIMPELEYVSANDMSFVGSFRVRVDGVDRLAPGSPPYESYEPISRPLTLGDYTTAELRDFYIRTVVGDVDLRLGKQQIVWGQLDGYKLLDQVNPQSFQEFTLEDFDQSRIGLWSVSAEFQVSSTDVQFVYSPDTTVSDLPEQDGLFAFRAPRFRFGLPYSTGGNTPSLEIEKPHNPFKHGVYAARISKYVDGWDLAFVGLTGLDHTPVARLNFEGNLPKVIKHYKRRTLFGASASTSFGSFVFRGETGFYLNRSFNTVGTLPNGIVKRNEITVAAALDYDGPAGLFLSAQVIYDNVLNAPENLARPQDDLLISLYARKYFRNETIAVDARLYAANGIFSDGLLRGKLTYILSDTTELSAGFDIFYGEPHEIYGQFSERDRLTFQIKHYF